MAATHTLLHRLRFRTFRGFTVAPPQGHRFCRSATSSSEEADSNPSCGTHTLSPSDVVEDPEWKDKEEKIVRDIQPIVTLTKNILYSQRYLNGEILTMEDERAIVENVLIHHPDYEDKIGTGLLSIMVDHHPLYIYPRCLFVVRTDGSWIDFSYRVCLEEYMKNKYHISAERYLEDISTCMWTHFPAINGTIEEVKNSSSAARARTSSHILNSYPSFSADAH